MNRRTVLVLVLARTVLPVGATRVGRLENAKSPRLRSPEGTLVDLAGDEEVDAVIRDTRLDGATIEVRGRLEDSRLRVDPSHTSPLRVIKDGRKLFVTYWCDTCAIRTYTPGICVCCRENTELDLKEAI